MSAVAQVIEKCVDVELVDKNYPLLYITKVQPFLLEILNWIKEGNTEYSIANKLDICQETFIKYKKEVLELSNVYICACNERNNLIMNSMYKKASGITKEVKKAKVLNTGEVIEYQEEVYIPPDVQAADLYLRNNSDSYKQAKQEQVLNINNNNFQLPQMQAEILKLEAELKKLEALEVTEFKRIE
jgi:hypothetical protein